MTKLSNKMRNDAILPGGKMHHFAKSEKAKGSQEVPVCKKPLSFTGRSLLALLLAFTMVPLVPSVTTAEALEPDIHLARPGLPASTTLMNQNTASTYTKIGFAGKQWDVIDLGEAGKGALRATPAAQSGKMAVLLSDGYDYPISHTKNGSVSGQNGSSTYTNYLSVYNTTQWNYYKAGEPWNEYKGSFLYKEMDSIGGTGGAIAAHNSYEQAVIKERTIPGGNVGDESSSWTKEGVAGDEVVEKLWPLSFTEASNISTTGTTGSLSIRQYTTGDGSYTNGSSRYNESGYGAPGVYQNCWWLRSPYSNTNATFVDYTGVVSYGNGVYGISFAVRPAFQLNLSSVIFTSAASESSGKNKASDFEPKPLTGATGIGSVEREMKLTFEEDAIAPGFTAENEPTGAGRTGEVVVNHSAVTSTTKKSVSALLTKLDESDAPTDTVYYTQMQQLTPTSSKFTVPNDAEVFENASKWAVNVFFEDRGGDNTSDFITPRSPENSFTLQIGTINADIAESETSSADFASVGGYSDITATPVPDKSEVFELLKPEDGGNIAFVESAKDHPTDVDDVDDPKILMTQDFAWESVNKLTMRYLFPVNTLKRNKIYTMWVYAFEVDKNGESAGIKKWVRTNGKITVRGVPDVESIDTTTKTFTAAGGKTQVEITGTNLSDVKKWPPDSGSYDAQVTAGEDGNAQTTRSPAINNKAFRNETLSLSTIPVRTEEVLAHA